jgi:DNA-binding MarR family transcriptional regulator
MLKNIVAYATDVGYIIPMFEECLYFNTNSLARTVSRIWKAAYRPFDLSPPHAFLLRAVLAKPGISPCELAGELNLSRSTITRFLDSLERRDLLERKPTEKDGRELQVFPTNKAKKIRQELDDIGKNLTKIMKQKIGKKELSLTVAQLRKIRKTIEKM